MFTLVPLSNNGYRYCAAFPCRRSDFWPSGFGSELAVPLEVDPGWWSNPKHPWLDNEDQDWPSDVARNCSRLGYEVSFSSGVPLIGRHLLQENDSYFWEHLTLGLISELGSIGGFSAWAWLRQELLMSLIPHSWIAPSDCVAVIHLAGEDRMFILTPREDLWEGWVAGHLASHFKLSEAHRSDANNRQSLQVITRWLLKASLGRGAQISKLKLQQGESHVRVSISGRWGRGTDAGLKEGEPLGQPFSKDWEFSA